MGELAGAVAARRRTAVRLSLHEINEALRYLPDPGRRDTELRSLLRRLILAQQKRQRAVAKAEAR